MVAISDTILGFAVGVIIGSVVNLIVSLIIDKVRLSGEKKRLGMALKTELQGIHDAEYEWMIVTPIYDALASELLLFKAETIETVLKAYHEIAKTKALSSAINSATSQELKTKIKNAITMLEKEIN